MRELMLLVFMKDIMSISKITRFLIFLSFFNALCFSSFAQDFIELPASEFEAEVSKLGKEVVKKFEISKKHTVTSGNTTKTDFWAVDGKAKGQTSFSRFSKTGILSIKLIVTETGEAFKTKYKLERKSQFSKWKIVE